MQNVGLDVAKLMFFIIFETETNIWDLLQLNCKNHGSNEK